MSSNKHSALLFILSLLIPIIVLLGMVSKPVSTMISGDEVVLATIPVDPRDLFYGDYVTLDLEIENVDATLLSSSLQEKIKNNNNIGDSITVYVQLKEGENGIYQASKVSEDKLDGVYIKGYMRPYIYGNNWNEELELNQYVKIEYGIERFYIEEGTGLKLEEQSRKGKVIVSSKIHNGYPILTGIKGVE